jgi:hypothetical protein
MPAFRNFAQQNERRELTFPSPPSAPGILKILSKNADLRRLGTTKVQTPVLWSGLEQRICSK